MRESEIIEVRERLFDPIEVYATEEVEVVPEPSENKVMTKKG